MYLYYANVLMSSQRQCLLLKFTLALEVAFQLVVAARLLLSFLHTMTTFMEQHD